MSEEIKLTSVICEYGEAFHGDSSDADGRDVLYAMETISSYIDGGCFELDEEEARTLRMRLGICLSGGGHWQSWCCEEDGCEVEPLDY